MFSLSLLYIGTSCDCFITTLVNTTNTCATVCCVAFVIAETNSCITITVWLFCRWFYIIVYIYLDVVGLPSLYATLTPTLSTLLWLTLLILCGVLALLNSTNHSCALVHTNIYLYTYLLFTMSHMYSVYTCVYVYECVYLGTYVPLFVSVPCLYTSLSISLCASLYLSVCASTLFPTPLPT